jgi:protein MpaA
MKNLMIEKIGTTVLNQSIDCWSFLSEENEKYILIVGGVHGDEVESIEIAEETIKNFLSNLRNNKKPKIGFKIIPILNKDGYFNQTRSNINDVDLNRNLPTNNWTREYQNDRYKPGSSPASEPETKAFLNLIKSYKPELIISTHSFKESLVLYNGIKTPYFDQVTKFAMDLNIQIVSKMNYETTGSLNTFGKEIDCPVFTIEFPRDHEWEQKRESYRRLFINLMNGFWESTKQ